MRRRDWKKRDWNRWVHAGTTATAGGRSGGQSEESSGGGGGRLKTCRTCGALIYLKCDWDGQWRPYESWVDGNVDEGEWIRHDCEL